MPSPATVRLRAAVLEAAALCSLVAMAGCANTVLTTDAEQAARATQGPPSPVPTGPPSAVVPAVPSQPGPAGPPQRPAVSSNDIKVRDLLDDPRLNAIFVRRAPSVARNPKLADVRDLGLNEVAGRPEYGISRELAADIVREANEGERR